MIVSKRNKLASAIFAPLLLFILRRKFSEISVNPIEIKKDHSVLLLMNHFSWWDGFLAGYLIHWHFKKNFHIMMQEDHIENRRWIRYLGGYSIKKNSKESIHSLRYTSTLLNNPENALIMFPQGELESMHVSNINIEKGVNFVLKHIEGNCQVIYSATIFEYFEGFKPQIKFSLLDCGTNKSVDINLLNEQINQHHKEALASTIRIIK